MGYSPWGRKESDTTERLTHTNSLLQRNTEGMNYGKSTMLSRLCTGFWLQLHS